MKKNKLVFCKGSDTIRQMPQNYLIAFRQDNRWICDPDIAADIKLAVKVFKALFVYEIRYGYGSQVVESCK